MNEEPTVSVIIPVFNGEAFLAEALQSILNQSLPPDEIIVVDDGSTDGTRLLVAEIAATASTPIRYIYQENQGPAAARNTAIQRSTGQWIAFLDADDLWPVEKLARQIACLAAYPRIQVLLGLTETWIAGAGQWSQMGTPWPSPLLGSLLCRRQVFEQIGYFAPELRFGEDVDWLLRLWESGLDMRRIPEVTLLYRLHGGNSVQQSAPRNAHTLAVLRASLARRRNGAALQQLPPIPLVSRPEGKRPTASPNPGVTVILPVYNGETFLHDALESVYQQEYQPLEVIVVDDGSTDGTSAAAAAWTDVRYLYQPNQGNGAAKNLGLRHATQPLIAFLDVDDRWLPTKLRLQVAALLDSPELGYVLCHMRAELAEGVNWPPHLNKAHYLSQPPLFAPSALLAWRRIFDQIGPFAESYRRSNDSDWFLRAKDKGVGMRVLPDVLVRKQIHSQNVSHETGPLTQELLAALRSSVQRGRQTERSALPSYGNR